MFPIYSTHHLDHVPNSFCGIFFRYFSTFRPGSKKISPGAQVHDPENWGKGCRHADLSSGRKSCRNGNKSSRDVVLRRSPFPPPLPTNQNTHHTPYIHKHKQHAHRESHWHPVTYTPHRISVINNRRCMACVVGCREDEQAHSSSAHHNISECRAFFKNAQDRQPNY